MDALLTPRLAASLPRVPAGAAAGAHTWIRWASGGCNLPEDALVEFVAGLDCPASFVRSSSTREPVPCAPDGVLLGLCIDTDLPPTHVRVDAADGTIVCSCTNVAEEKVQDEDRTESWCRSWWRVSLPGTATAVEPYALLGPDVVPAITEGRFANMASSDTWHVRVDAGADDVVQVRLVRLNLFWRRRGEDLFRPMFC